MNQYQLNHRGNVPGLVKVEPVKLTELQLTADGDVIWDPSCRTCTESNPFGIAFVPSHRASSRCQSGGRNHCTCDSCF